MQWPHLAMGRGERGGRRGERLRGGGWVEKKFLSSPIGGFEARNCAERSFPGEAAGCWIAGAGMFPRPVDERAGVSPRVSSRVAARGGCERARTRGIRVDLRGRTIEKARGGRRTYQGARNFTNADLPDSRTSLSKFLAVRSTAPALAPSSMPMRATAMKVAFILVETWESGGTRGRQARVSGRSGGWCDRGETSRLSNDGGTEIARASAVERRPRRATAKHTTPNKLTEEYARRSGGDTYRTR